MKRYYFGTNPLGPSRKVKAAIRKAAKDINTPPDDIRRRLERLLLSKYGADDKNVLFANSLKELIFIICRGLQPGKVLIAGPALNIYREAAEGSGAVIEALSGTEEDAFSPDLLKLIEKAEGSDLVMIANPNRVSGKVLSEAVLTELLSALSMKDCITLVDESLMDFVGDDGCLRRAVSSRSIVVLRTTACYYGLPGLELAFAVGGAMMIESLRRGILGEPSIPAMEAARTALKDRSYRRVTGQFMNDEKRLLSRAISRMPGLLLYDSDTNIFLLKAGDLSVEISRKAVLSGLAVETCSDSDMLDDRFLRISVMKHEHNRMFIKLLNEVSQGRAEMKSGSV